MADDPARKARRKRGPAADDVPVVELSSFEVTFEPLDDEPPMPAEVARDYQALHGLVRRRPADAVGRLEALVGRFPDARQLYTLLAAAYAGVGDAARSDAVTEACYRRFPDYLFARVNFAEQCLRRGEVDRVLEVFGGTLDLKRMYPHRDVFHVSEVVGFLYVLGRYLLERGEFAQVENAYDAVRALAPDHPTAKAFGHLMLQATLRKMTARVAKLGRRKPRSDKGKPRRPRGGPPNAA